MREGKAANSQRGSLSLFRPGVIVSLIFGLAALTGILGIVLMRSEVFPAIPALGLSGGAFVLGWALLTWVPHTVRWDESTLSMVFWFRQDRVAWESVQGYRKLWGPQEFPGDRDVTVAVFVRYRLSESNRPGSARAILVVPAENEGERRTFFPAVERYVTPFDRYAGSKSLRRG